MRTATQDIKLAIAQSLKEFGNGSLRANATQLFNTLGYISEKTIELSPNTPENFIHEIDQQNQLRKEKALFSKWESVDFIFQITGEEIKAGGSGQLSLQFDSHQKIDNRIIESYLFLAIELSNGHYTRTELSTITREINKLFPMPVLILFQHGDALTLSVIRRRPHKREKSKDVLEKVTLIKDIRFDNPHRAHIEILFDLSFSNLYNHYRFSNFIALHDAWQKTLDINELNKRFYKELADWYFWAVNEVTFPSQNEIKDEEIRNATNVIRMITRLIFVWFVKEKGLVPDDLFNIRKLQEVLKDLSPEKTTYYKAILQNLFFATLNQEMNTPKKPDNRKFRNKAKKAGARDQHYMIPNVYRYEDYFKNPDQAIKIFADIPFLNGGLFECLDNYDTEPVTRIDGFSDRKDNELHIPNFLFFSDEQTVDLNEDYGTRNKAYKVRGLIDLLQSYKFTITENTPIEEEIALDPELLGRVFENLLASYNPETGTTARKQTGSFYTPREIVDYMVDESLKASLSNLVAEKLADSTEEDIRTGLDILFAYTEKEHAFNDEEVSKIVETVSDIKILDPACGSGAFPMGVLHKLVYILGKLDLENTQWKELQKQRAIKETKEAYNMGNKEERHQRLGDIEEAFEFNTSDYGRKLYLIENCIYGVDIQPIAVQIAKLRFFISLVVDQRIDDTQENRGILPLPNLETKFVAANTLIGVEGPRQGKLPSIKIRAEINQKESELVSVRRNHFTSRTLQTKRKWRARDAQLRAEISDLLKKEDFPSETTQKLAYWDPYGQNISADFFDSEWMFNVSNGFDIVIGNPPYVRIQKVEKTLKNLFSQNYQSATKNYDIYTLFDEKGIELLRSDGFLAYIQPNKFFNADYGIGLRKHLTSNNYLHKLVNFGNAQMFDTATNYTTLLFCKKSNNEIFTYAAFSGQDVSRQFLNYVAGIRSENTINTQFSAKYVTSGNWVFGDDETLSLFEKLESVGKPLAIFTQKTFQGLVTGADPVYCLEEVDGKLRSHFLNEFVDIPFSDLKPLLKGKEIQRYGTKPNKYWLIFPYSLSGSRPKLYSESEYKSSHPEIWNYLKRCEQMLRTRENGKMNHTQWYAFGRNQNLDQFEQSKLMLQVLAKRASITLDENNNYYFVGGGNAGGYGLTLKKDSGLNYKYLLGLLNSTLLDFYLQKHSSVFQNGYYSYAKRFIEKIPLVKIPKNDQQAFIVFVNQTLTTKRNDPNAHIATLEAEIDARVAHLYNLTEEEYSFVLRELKLPDPFSEAAINFYRNIAGGILK